MGKSTSAPIQFYTTFGVALPTEVRIWARYKNCWLGWITTRSLFYCLKKSSTFTAVINSGEELLWSDRHNPPRLGTDDWIGNGSLLVAAPIISILDAFTCRKPSPFQVLLLSVAPLFAHMWLCSTAPPPRSATKALGNRCTSLLRKWRNRARGARALLQPGEPSSFCWGFRAT